MSLPAAVRTPRLDAATWVDAGLNLLAAGGVDAVRVEPLARVLGVTKGSFYWHFKDRDDLLAAMLESWRRDATLNVIKRLETSQQSPLERLRKLIDLPVKGSKAAHGANVEMAIRVWARADGDAAAALAEIDRQRLAYIGALLSAEGPGNAEKAEAHAYIYYAYILAEAFVSTPLSACTRQACEQFLLLRISGDSPVLYQTP